MKVNQLPDCHGSQKPLLEAWIILCCRARQQGFWQTWRAPRSVSVSIELPVPAAGRAVWPTIPLLQEALKVPRPEHHPIPKFWMNPPGPQHESWDWDFSRRFWPVLWPVPPGLPDRKPEPGYRQIDPGSRKKEFPLPPIWRECFSGPSWLNEPYEVPDAFPPVRWRQDLCNRWARLQLQN